LAAQELAASAASLGVSPSNDTLATAWANITSASAEAPVSLLEALGHKQPGFGLSLDLYAESSGLSLYSQRSGDEHALQAGLTGSQPHTPLGSQNGSSAFAPVGGVDSRRESQEGAGRSNSLVSLAAALQS
jgi:hypothetical protein